MAEKNSRRNQTTDALFDAILSLRTREECYNFFEDLCTVKEISDMAQRLEAAKMLLDGSTYDQIVKAACLDGSRRRYAADRGQCDAWQGRIADDGTNGGCDEGVCTGRDQLYPLGQ